MWLHLRGRCTLNTEGSCQSHRTVTCELLQVWAIHQQIVRATLTTASHRPSTIELLSVWTKYLQTKCLPYICIVNINLLPFYSFIYNLCNLSHIPWLESHSVALELHLVCELLKINIYRAFELICVFYKSFLFFFFHNNSQKDIKTTIFSFHSCLKCTL